MLFIAFALQHFCWLKIFKLLTAKTSPKKHSIMHKLMTKFFTSKPSLAQSSQLAQSFSSSSQAQSSQPVRPAQSAQLIQPRLPVRLIQPADSARQPTEPHNRNPQFSKKNPINFEKKYFFPPKWVSKIVPDAGPKLAPQPNLKLSPLVGCFSEFLSLVYIKSLKWTQKRDQNWSLYWVLFWPRVWIENWLLRRPQNFKILKKNIFFDKATSKGIKLFVVILWRFSILLSQPN